MICNEDVKNRLNLHKGTSKISWNMELKDKFLLVQRNTKIHAFFFVNMHFL